MVDVVLLDPTGEKLLVFLSEDSLIVLVFTFYPLTFFDASQSMAVFVAFAKDTNICTCRATWHGNLRDIHHCS